MFEEEEDEGGVPVGKFVSCVFFLSLLGLFRVVY